MNAVLVNSSKSARGDTARLLLLPLLACAADVTLTLLGQPDAYWAGDRSAVLELNPAARCLLRIHPMAFVLAGMTTSAIVAKMVLTGRRPLAVGVSLLVTIGHTLAVAAWLAKSGPAGWAAAVAVMFLVWFALPPRRPSSSNGRR